MSFAPQPRPPEILVFDSGLGGLTVLAEIDRLRPEARRLYVADDAVFPYGDLGERALVDRVMTVLAPLIEANRPDAVVVACNTASTAVLPSLRTRWPDLAVVGTVPAIKPAAAASLTRRISVLATPGTVARDYTRDLVASFAADCAVDLVGAPRLAALAEHVLRGEFVSDEAVRQEIAPAFVDRDGRRTDTVVLACTHYPLLVSVFERVAPWPVTYVDPAPAIARRVDTVLAERGFPSGVAGDRWRDGASTFTSGRSPGAALARVLTARGLGRVVAPVPPAPALDRIRTASSESRAGSTTEP
jgi:glutamate racemase